MSHVLRRSAAGVPTIDHGRGCELFDTDGRRYLDASGGALVVNLGHGVDSVVDVMAEQARRVAYVHGTRFTSEALEHYSAEVAAIVPVEDASVYQVSGGSEAVETALKLARAFHLARGEPSRHVVIGREGSYHGNTRGALDVSGRESFRRPYLPWLGLAEHVLAAYEYRCGIDSHPVACGVRHGEELDAAIMRLGPENVAAFIAEPVAGAVLGAAVPPEDYWLSIANVCRRHGVLLIADEVMTGFGRTGRWFGLDHFGVRADLLVAGKGASSGYWPLGLCVASGRVTAAVEGGAGFVHGFTYSHHVVGAAVGLEVLRLLRDESLVARSALQGRRLLAGLRSALADEPHAGDVRGLGLMAGVELVADPVTRVPFARELRVTERVVAALTARGVLVYSSTGCADGTNGDLVLLGPPFVVSDAEIDEIVEAVAAAVREVTAGLRPELAD